MKKIILLPFLIFILQSHAQTLFSFGSHKVSAAEFLNAFQKNRTDNDTGKAALENYLNLYIAYKLKVQAAKDMRLDTLAELQADLQSFLHQIEPNYLYDRKELDFLTEQALQRSKKDIHITTYFVHSDVVADSSRLKKAASQLASSLRKNPGATLSSVDKDGIAVTTGDLGYITVFTLPYAMENVIYELREGAISKPFKFDEGYIIFKNEGERPAAGKIKLAQILIAADTASDASVEKARLLADSIFHQLKAGADFAELASRHSNDRTTWFNGGEMPEFKVGKYAPDFESHAFALKTDGEISKPFKTDFGFHILKRISASPVPQNPSPDFVYQLRLNLLGEPRVEIARSKLIAEAKAKTGFRSLQTAMPDVYIVTDSAILANRDVRSRGIDARSELFSFADGTVVKVSDWEIFLRNSGRVNSSDLHASYELLWPEFTDKVVLDNYAKHLADFDPEFARQKEEFRDGNMLFEVMQRHVWLKASNDTASLKAYFNNHRSRYKWKESADAIIFSCDNQATAQQCIAELNTMPWRDVMEKHAAVVQADSGRYEISQLPISDGNFSPGITKPIINKFDGTAVFARIIKVYPANMPREFSDARGLVIEDYQKVLEDQWLVELKKKYPVRVDHKVFGSLRP